MFRRRSTRGLLFEVIGVVSAVAIAATVAFVYQRRTHPPPHNERPIGGAQIALAHVRYAQIEPAAAADPANPSSLVAMSIDRREGTRLYESHDGGRTWRTRVGPPMIRSVCGREDPSLAFVGGRLLAALTSSADCSPLTPELTLSTRERGRWSTRIILRSPSDATLPPFDAAPSLAVGSPRKRVYLLWLRTVQRFGTNEIVNEPRLLLTRSDDGGRTWRKPVRIAPPSRTPYARAIAVGPHGDVYVAVADAESRQLEILRSTNGGASFGAPRTVTPLRDVYQPGCGRGGFVPSAQQQRCVGVSPTLVALPSGEVVVVYADPDEAGNETVFVARFARDLRPLRRPRRLGSSDDGGADEFEPVAAYDPSVSVLWVCYYDTHGDHDRTHSWFTCTHSRNGGTSWTAPVRAAAQPTLESRPASDPEGYGDAQALVAVDGRAHPFWTDRRGELIDEDIYTTILRVRR